MCMYKTVYTVYAYQYTWKVTVKDFIISKITGLQLKALLKMCFFTGFFRGNFNLLETPSYRNSLIMAMTKYCNIKTRDVLVIKLFKYDVNKF